MSMCIRKANAADARTLAEMAALLFHHDDLQALQAEFEALTQHAEAACFLAENGDAAVGFAQCQLRHDYVEGTETSPVGSLEGIYVAEDWRGLGGARALRAAWADGARARGCREFASDCELDNEASIGFHRAVGFAEANRIVCFAKRL